jgi:diguanylate cyclase (GGDEF)-like protein
LLAWGFGSHAGTMLATAWFLAITTLVVVRLLVVKRLMASSERSGDYRLLRQILVFGALVSGCIWGSGGVIFFDPKDAYGFALLVIALGGVVAGSLGPHSYYFPNYAAFAVPTMTPLILVLFQQESSFYRLVAVAMLFYLALNLYYSRQYESMVVRSIQLQFHNADLLQELQESNRRLQRYSFTDSLTGIANRRQFDLDFDTACHQAQDQDKPLALLLLDVDHFKRYNDTHGHAAGDEVLRGIAAILLEACQELDACGQPARIGGEEFAVLVWQDEQEASRIAETLRRRIEKRLQPEGGQVTISIGVGCRQPASKDGPKALFQQADRNLYRAKAAGRNQVVAG